jgi:hypothetical protein
MHRRGILIVRPRPTGGSSTLSVEAQIEDSQLRQIHDYIRHSFQLLTTWFTAFATINYAAFAWMASRDGVSFAVSPFGCTGRIHLLGSKRVGLLGREKSISRTFPIGSKGPSTAASWQCRSHRSIHGYRASKAVGNCNYRRPLVHRVVHHYIQFDASYPDAELKEALCRATGEPTLPLV